MKILLVAVNAKYTHMNPAVYSIRAYAGDAGKCMEIAEYTINQYPRDVLRDIYERAPDVIGFSCYIWNMNFIGEMLRDIKKVLPKTLVFLGGPEVAYNREAVLEKYPAVDGVFYGDGERAWKELICHLIAAEDIGDIPGLQIRGRKSCGNYPQMTEMDDIPFIYDDLELFDNRMLYYETSRGCPFRCSYCLSSVDKRMRFRSLDKVLPELQHFLDHNVRIVKFIDRTFNASHEHAMTIWKYLADHDNGVSRFHFEIEADLLSEDEMAFLQTVRPGLFQFEVGVQSVNRDTLKAINRHADIDRIKDRVTRLVSYGNIPVHVDLIAGLPFEDLRSFRNSFNEVYGWGAEELQLGFLKLLHGTEMEQKADEYGIVCEEAPVYEVLSTRWLTYDDINYLKDIEEQLERYGNSGAYRYTVAAFEQYFTSPFDMYAYIADYYRENMDRFRKQSRISSYEMLRGIIAEKLQQMNAVFGGWNLGCADSRHFDALLLIDLYLKEKLKVRPEFIAGAGEQRSKEREYIRAHSIAGTVHIEFFDFDVWEFIHDGDIIEKEKDSCVVIFSYEGQGAASSVQIKCADRSEFLKQPTVYDIK